MSKRSSILCGLLLVASIGGAVKEYWAIHERRQRILELQQHIDRDRLRYQTLRATEHRSNPSASEAQAGESNTSRDDPINGRIRSFLEKQSGMKRWFASNPRMTIPEMTYLTADDWLEAATGRLSNDADYRRSAAQLRYAAMNHFAPIMQQALLAYVQANQGMLPNDVHQLAPYFSQPVDPAVLGRYEMYSTGSTSNSSNSRALGLNSSSVVDEDYDRHLIFIGVDGFGSEGLPDEEPLAVRIDWAKAQNAYSQANNGARYPQDNPEALVPFFQNTADAATFMDLQNKWRAARQTAAK